MGYIDRNLITDESVAYRARLHGIVLLKPFLVSLGLVAAAAMLVYVGSKGESPDQARLLNWMAVTLVGIAAIPIIAGLVKRSSAEFAVTNKRVILKVGFMTSKTAEMFLNKIESVGVDQSILGRIFGYGSIVIRGTGGSLEPFDRVSAPLEFRRRIQEEIGKSFGPVSRPTRG